MGEENKPETYVVAVFCYNCKAGDELKIPKRETVKQFLRGVRCDNCGCLID